MAKPSGDYAPLGGLVHQVLEDSIRRDKFCSLCGEMIRAKYRVHFATNERADFVTSQGDRLLGRPLFGKEGSALASKRKLRSVRSKTQGTED
jgi:hypothetical protein